MKLVDNAFVNNFSINGLRVMMNIDFLIIFRNTYEVHRQTGHDGARLENSADW